MKRNANLELARVIACLMVIGCHVLLPACNNGVYEKGRVFFQCIFADGVGIFWLLTGAFLFRSTYSKALKSMLKKIVIPLVLFSIFSFFFCDTITNGTSVIESITANVDAWNTLKAILSFRNPISSQSHLWYLYTHIFIILFLYPFMKLFVDYMDKNPKAEKLFILISGIVFILNDITTDSLAGFEYENYGKAVAGATLMIWGHIIYRNREKFDRKIFIFASIIVWIASNTLRCVLQLYCYYNGTQDDIHLLYWYSFFGVINSCCIIIGSIALGTWLEKCGGIIRHFGKLTFLIYLFHYTIVKFLFYRGYSERLQNLIFNNINNYIVAEIVYMIAMIVIVFVITYIFALIVDLICKGINRLSAKDYQSGK